MLQQNFIPLGVISLTWVLVGLQPGVRQRHRERAHRRPEARSVCATSGGAAAGPARRQLRHRHPDPGLRGLPDDVRGHHAGARHRRRRQPPEAAGLGGLPRGVVDPRLPADRALAVGARGLADLARGPGLGRRHGGARLGRRRRAGPARGPRPAPGLARSCAAAALDPAGRPRGRHPLVRVVRVQRRRRAAGQRRRRPGPVNTQVAAAAAMLVWLVVERVKDGHATVLGGVTGAVGGPGDDHPGGRLRQHDLGRRSSARSPALVCHLALRLKTVFRYDDALDVIAVHFVGGVLGSLLVGLLRRRGHQQHRRRRAVLRRRLRAPRASRSSPSRW